MRSFSFRLSFLSLLLVFGFCAEASGGESGRVRLPSEGYRVEYEMFLQQAQVRGENLAQWKRFQQEHGTWSAIWNPLILNPHRAWGEGYQIPGYVFINKYNAEAAARTFLRSFRDLLRCDPEQLAVTSVSTYGGKWLVHFQQRYKGLPVLFSEVIVHMTERGRVYLFGSDFRPRIELDVTPTFAPGHAAVMAFNGLGVRPDIALAGEGELAVMPVTSEEGETVHLVYHFFVDQDDLHKWETWVDAHTGEVLWRYNVVMDGIGGKVTGRAHSVKVTDTEVSKNMPHLQVQVGTANVYTDSVGNYNANVTTSSTVTARLRGKYVNVLRQDAPSASFTTTASNGSTVNIVWNNSNSHSAERNAYYHVNVAHDYVTSLDPQVTGLNYRMNCKVNVNNVCNAFWDGSGVNFFRSGKVGGRTCANTGEMPDVIYHEYGHGVNTKVYIQFGSPQGMKNGALQEGMADVFAAFIQDNSKIGKGFFGPGTIMRDINNTRKYPDHVTGRVHDDGLIIGGAFWDTRKRIGLARAEYVAQFAKHSVPDDNNLGRAFAEYFIATLEADDNDGNLANGTPNSAKIAEAFAIHGIPASVLSISHTPVPDSPANTPIPVSAEVKSGWSEIKVSKVRVYYSTGSGYTAVELSNTGGNTWSGDIPGLPAGSFVDYYIEAQETWGSKLSYPPGAPANHLSFLVGFQQAFFHDFESDQNWKGGVQGDDALTGRWIRDVPIPTFVSTQPVQPGADHTASGTKCYVTGNGTPGGQPGENDVDEGKTTLESPVFNASTYNVPVIRYWRWFSNDLGAAPGNDPWVVQISSDGGSNWVDLENTKAAMNAWIPRMFKIADYVTPTANMKLRFIARDQDPQSLVEAAVDDVELLYVTIVPVELESFSAARSGTGALLRWTTAAETNNFGFEIQYRLLDGDWQRAGFVSGSGTTTEPRQYSYTIPEAPDRDFFVRLKQIDFDGAYELLPERFVPAAGGRTRLLPGYPNPVTGGENAATIRYFLSEPMLVRIEIVDLLGKTRIIALNAERNGGFHELPVTFTGMPSGTYLVRMFTKNGVFHRILKILR